MRWRLAFGALGVALSASWLASCEDEQVASLCEPSAEIFCRCPDGAAGVKRCSAKGDAFGSCEGCADRPDPTGGSASSGQGGGVGEGLLRPCTDDAACASNNCQFGYCTVTCTKVSDCEYPKSECVSYAGATVCMPVCALATDCGPFGAPQSKCGYAPAIDNWGVTVCADWGAEHALVPVDSDCTPFEHTDCNLGYDKRERVCTAEGVCKAGCYSAADCTAGKQCSSDGSALGSCQ